MEQEELRALMAAMGLDDPVGLFDPYRYAIQVAALGVSATDALDWVLSSWKRAVKEVEAPAWIVDRLEVISTEEFEHDLVSEGGDQTLARVEQDLLHRVFFDSLTGLPRRPLLADMARKALLHGADAVWIVAWIDIDALGDVNRLYGYSYGDEALIQVARRLERACGPGRIVVRWGGDSFVLLIDASHEPGGPALVDRLLDSLRRPLLLPGRTIRLTASIGVSIVESDDDLDPAVSRAAAAMCAAKRAGGDRAVWAAPGLEADCARLDLDVDNSADRSTYLVLLERAAMAANECSTLEEAVTIVLHQVCAQTGWRAGHLWMVDDRGASLLPTGVWHTEDPGERRAFAQRFASHPLEPGQGQAGTVLLTGVASGITVHDQGWAPSAAAGQLAVRSVFATPVVVGTDVVAVLEFFSSRSERADERLVDVMAGVGAQLGRIVERARTATVLAGSEERYRMLADALPIVVIAVDEHGACTFVNRWWSDLTGLSIDESLGEGWSTAIHRNDQTACAETVRWACRRREPFDVEFRVRGTDGTFHPFLGSARPVFEGGRFMGCVAGLVDVTDRERAEDRAVARWRPPHLVVGG